MFAVGRCGGKHGFKEGEVVDVWRMLCVDREFPFGLGANRLPLS